MRNIGLIVGAALAAACVGTAGDEVERATVTFKAEGGSLALESAPLRREYRATYPNPRAHTWVKVEVTSDARLTVACKSASRTECSDSPVTVSVEGDRVRAYDVYNVALAELPYTGRRCAPRPGTPEGGSPIDPGPGGRQPPHGLDEGGGAGSAPAPGGAAGTTPLREQAAQDPTVALALEDPGDVDDDDDDDARCPGGGEPVRPCQEPEARRVFCGALNEGLAAHKLPAYDCAHLDVERAFAAPQLDGEIACKRQVVKPAGDRARAGYPGCKELVRTWENRSLAEVRDTGLCGGSPLVLDLDGDGLHTVGLEGGVRFDLFGTGAAPRVGWVGAGDGLLALDFNQNGVVDDGTELFGQSTFAQSHADGFAALARLDGNADGVVDARDPGFHALVVWVDRDLDGVGPRSEWLTLPEAGVASLSTRSHRVVAGGVADPSGNWVPLRAHFERADGRRGQLADVWFQTRR